VHDVLDSKPPRSLTDRIGGRWAISLFAFVLNAMVSLVGLTIVVKFFETTSEMMFTWALVWLGAISATGLSVAIAHFTLLRNRRTKTVHPVLVVFVNVVFGAVYATIISFYLQKYEIYSPDLFWTNFFGNVLLALWWGITLAVMLDIREETHRDKDELVQLALQNAHIEMQQFEITEILRNEINSEVDVELENVREKIENRIDSLIGKRPTNIDDETSNWRETSSLLRTAASQSIRPMSKKLWERNFIHYPKTPWWSVVVNIWQRQPFRPLLFIFIDALGAAPEQIQLFGFSRALTLIFGIWILISSIALIANSLMKRYPRFHAQIFSIGLLLTLSFVPIRSFYREQWTGTPVTSSWVISQVIVGALVVLVASGFGALNDVNQQSRRNFLTDIDQSFINTIARSQKLAEIARDTARVLHGAVQTRLIACAMEIERASVSGDKQILSNALEEAMNILSSPLPREQVSLSLEDEIARKVSLWTAFCDIEVRIESILCDATAVQLSGRIVEEAISNAIRHGKAESIQIGISESSPGILRIRVSDDGTLITNIQPGIGTALIEQSSGGKWSLSTVDQRTELEVFLAQSH
jgi:hypothetical protein